MKKINMPFFKNFGKKNEDGSDTGFSRTKFWTAGKTFFTHDIIAKILCVFAAVCLWSYVIDTQSTTYRETYSGVEVTFRNTGTNRKGLEVMSSDRYTVDVVLSGKRSVLSGIRSSDITAYVDISQITEAGEYPLNISVATAKAASLEEVLPKSLYVYVDKPSSRSVRVRAEYTGGTSDDKTLKIGALETSRSYVTVQGPEEVLATIAEAEVTVELSQINRSVNIKGVTPILLDESGNEIDNPYVSILDKQIDVYVPVNMEKELPVVPEFQHGYFDADVIEYTAKPSTVTVRGEIEEIENLTEIGTAPIDETLIGSSQTLQLDYKLPDGVSLAGTRTKCSMQLSIKNYRERQITFIARRITVEGVEDGLAAEAASPLFLTVCGTYDVVSQLSASDIKAYISADGLSEGTYYDYPVEVVFGSDEVRNVFIKNASDCTADLIITKAENTNE